MEAKITEKEFNEIVNRYENDNKLFTKLEEDRKKVEEDIYKACKFDLIKFGDIFPSGAYYYMEVLS